MSNQQNTEGGIRIVQAKNLKRNRTFIDKNGVIHKGGAEAYFNANPGSKSKPSF